MTDPRPPLRAAVVGAGRFGRHHARHYAASPLATLVAVVDPDPAAAAAAAGPAGAAALGRIEDLAGRVDVASVATPTATHAAVAARLLEMGVHVLVEKPITDHPADAARLIALAAARGLVLQVGHVERRNPAFRALAAATEAPRFIEARRLNPWSGRADSDVVLDLMIHDLDLALALTGSRAVAVEAVGAAVFGTAPDIANARIRFENGCVANLSAARVAPAMERRIAVIQPGALLVCDLAARTLARHAPDEGAAGGLATTALSVADGDALGAEVAEFLRCAAAGARPEVDGAAGLAALDLAARVLDCIRTDAHHAHGAARAEP